jgi:hypothetical protein
MISFSWNKSRLVHGLPNAEKRVQTEAISHTAGGEYLSDTISLEISAEILPDK